MFDFSTGQIVRNFRKFLCPALTASGKQSIITAVNSGKKSVPVEFRLDLPNGYPQVSDGRISVDHMRGN